MVGGSDTPEVLWETFIPIKPVRWSVSARVLGKFASLYSPTKLKQYQKQVTSFLVGAYHFEPINEPCMIRCIYHLPKPKTVKRAYPSVMPDLTNLHKALEDCLTKGGVLSDDNIVVGAEIYKIYGEAGKVGTEVIIVSL